MATATATGNGATAMIDQSHAMAPGQGHWGRGNRSNCNSNGATGATGGNGATALLSLPLRSIDRVCVCGRVGRGRGRQHDRLLFRVF
jgi:hypothetical protein